MDAEVLLNGMLAKDRLLDIVENFILFDESKPGATRKVVARNHQVLGVNNAVASVARQEELKRSFRRRSGSSTASSNCRWKRRAIADRMPSRPRAEAQRRAPPTFRKVRSTSSSGHIPNSGQLGVFWHTQGSGKSYSMAFFAEKVRRKVPGNFTFLLMTDRNDLDSQIYGTFVGCGVVDQGHPARRSGEDLKDSSRRTTASSSASSTSSTGREPEQPYSERDDIIVISDEAHRTQAGKLARNMRLALPNAAFIGFTGTPLFKHDQLTKRIFGDYVSRYDFKRSEEDGATVKLV